MAAEIWNCTEPCMFENDAECDLKTDSRPIASWL